MVKAVTFFDLDGTLLNAQTKLDADVIEAMHVLRKNDVLPVISSGRNLFEIRDIMAQTGIDSVVSANGDYVILNGQPIYEARFDLALMQQFDTFTSEKTGDAFAALNDQGARLNKPSQVADQAYDHVNSPVPAVDNQFWQTAAVYMMIVFTDHNDELYQQTFADDFTFYRNTPYSMDIVIKGGSKQTGMKQLLNRTQFKGVPTYAFGDGNNDISMLELVDHPIAMGNALPHVKPYAEFVTTANIDHGIVNGLKHFDLI
ncbi:Cof-type HAD-IIB family hydrolase [Secundilactobacillus kimchicus]|uniref:Cof-type HAD-IIB family hydrolase n=1 Tax=Secundilactobacillus kimchicus TaxID=528209 RepID=UPI0024A84B43|nr:Cof-type HAD-IIB family hydrolase [Secundilactobacillus kimchicus]